MSYFNIFWGYPGAGEEGVTMPGMLGVTPNSLVFRIRGDREPLVLTDAEVVNIRAEGSLFLRNQVIEVEHIAFNKAGSVVFHPVEESIDQLLLRISCIGFKPKAQPAEEWDPRRGPPPAKEGEQLDG